MGWKFFFTDYPLGQLTASYHRQHLSADTRQAVAIGSLWLMPAFLLAIIDLFQQDSQPVFAHLLVLRLALIIGLLAGFYLLKKVRHYQAYSWVAFSLVCFALGNVLAGKLLRFGVNPFYSGMDYIILLSIYLLIPNKTMFRLVPCLLFSLATLLCYGWLKPGLSLADFSVLLITHLFANALGIVASAKFYAYRRQQFESQSRALELRKDLIQNALLDELTGVANRRLFFRTGEEEFERFRRYKRPFSLLMLDLDHFKQINDQFGHPVGDMVLKDLSQTVTRCKRETDLFGRLGGEEFALLLPETGLSGATDIAVRLRRACHAIHVPGTNGAKITVSIGATQIRLDDGSFDEVLSRADAALYRAKHCGRDRVEVG